MGNDKTVSGSGPSAPPPQAIILEPIVITAGQPIPEVKEVKPSPPPVSPEEFKKLTAEVKNLGVNLEGLTDAGGNILSGKVQEARARIEAQAKELEKSNPTFAARLYKSALQLDPQNIGLRADTARALRSAVGKAGNPEVRNLHEQEAQGQLKAVEQRFVDGLNPVRELLANGRFQEAREEATKLSWRFLNGLSADQKKTLLDSLRFQSLIIQSTFALAQSLEGLGEGATAKRLYQRALSYWDKAVLARPQDAEAFRLRAEVHHQLGNYKGALSDHKISVQLDPKGVSGTAPPAGAGPAGGRMSYEERLARQAARSTLKGVEAMESKKPREAQIYLTESIRIHEAMGNQEAVRTLSEKLANVLKETGFHSVHGEIQKMASQGFLSEDHLKKNNDKILKYLEPAPGGSIRFKESFSQLKDSEKAMVLREVSRLGLLGQAQALAKQETDPTKKLYYESKIDLLQGNIPAARLKMIDFKAKTEGTKDPELRKMREEVRGILREGSLQSVERLRERNEALKAQRTNRIEGKIFKDDPRPYLNGRIIHEMELWIRLGRADTPEEAMTLLSAEHKKLQEAFQKDPVIRKNWIVTLPKGVPFVKLNGGALEINDPSPKVRVTLGKEGGTISIQRMIEGAKKISVFYEHIHFPPGEKERTLSIQNGKLVAPDLRASQDYRVCPRGSEPAGYKKLKREDFLGKHPETYAPVVEYFNHLKLRDPDFLALFNLETRSDLEKMKTPETRRQHLLEVAQQVRHRNGSYMVVGQILEELFAKDFQRAKATITEKQRTEISKEVEKERPKIEKEVRKSLEKLKKEKSVEWMQRYPKGGPSGTEFKELVTDTVKAKTELKEKKLVFEKLDTLYKKQALFDDVAHRAWKIYENMKDPLDKFFTISDEGIDAIVDEVVTSVVTMPITMGVGSAVRGALGGTSLALRLAGQGGVRAFGARAGIFASGALAEGFTMEGVGAALFTGEFHLKNAGFNMLMSTAFHGGGKIWGKTAEKLKVSEAAMAAAKERGQSVLGRQAFNAAGMISTQTSVATAMSYAHEILGDEGPPRTFWERLGGEALRMVSFHYGTHAMNRMTGHALTRKETLSQNQLQLSQENYKILRERYTQQYITQGLPEKLALKLAKTKALNEAVEAAREGKNLRSMPPPIPADAVVSIPRETKPDEVSHPSPPESTSAGKRKAVVKKTPSAEMQMKDLVSGLKRNLENVPEGSAEWSPKSRAEVFSEGRKISEALEKGRKGEAPSWLGDAEKVAKFEKADPDVRRAAKQVQESVKLIDQAARFLEKNAPSIKEGKIRIPEELFDGLRRNMEVVGRWRQCSKELNRFVGEIHDFVLSQVQEIGARNIDGTRAREKGIEPPKPRNDVEVVNVEHPQWGDDPSLTVSFYQRAYVKTSSAPYEVWITVKDQKVKNARGEWVSDQQRFIDDLKQNSGMTVLGETSDSLRLKTASGNEFLVRVEAADGPAPADQASPKATEQPSAPLTPVGVVVNEVRSQEKTVRRVLAKSKEIHTVPPTGVEEPLQMAANRRKTVERPGEKETVKVSYDAPTVRRTVSREAFRETTGVGLRPVDALQSSAEGAAEQVAKSLSLYLVDPLHPQPVSGFEGKVVVDASIEGLRVLLRERNYGRPSVEGFEDFKHIVERHAHESANRGDKAAGVYTANVDIENVARETVRNFDRIKLSFDENGQFCFVLEKTFAHSIGTTSGLKPGETNTNVVILSYDGKIATSFPAKESKKGSMARDEIKNPADFAVQFSRQSNADPEVMRVYHPFFADRPGSQRENLYASDGIPIKTVNERTRSDYGEEQLNMETQKFYEMTLADGVKIMVAEKRFSVPIGIREGPNGEKIPLYWNRTYFRSDKPGRPVLGGYPIREVGEAHLPETVWNPSVRAAPQKEAAQDLKMAAHKKQTIGERPEDSKTRNKGTTLVSESAKEPSPPKAQMEGKLYGEIPAQIDLDRISTNSKSPTPLSIKFGDPPALASERLQGAKGRHLLNIWETNGSYRIQFMTDAFSEAKTSPSGKVLADSVERFDGSPMHTFKKGGEYLLQIGNHRFTLRLPVEPAPGQAGELAAFRMGRVEPPEPRIAPEPEKSFVPQLIDSKGKEISMTKLAQEGDRVTLGRGGDVVIGDPHDTLISAQHATIFLKIEGGQSVYEIRDGVLIKGGWKPSLNKTFVNGKEIPSERGTLLNPGDRVRIGDQEFTWRPPSQRPQDLNRTITAGAWIKGRPEEYQAKQFLENHSLEGPPADGLLIPGRRTVFLEGAGRFVEEGANREFIVWDRSRDPVVNEFLSSVTQEARKAMGGRILTPSNPKMENDLATVLNLFRDRLRERFRNPDETAKQALARLESFSDRKMGKEVLLGEVLEGKFPFCRHLALLTQTYLSDLGLRDVRMQRGFLGGGGHVWNEVMIGGEKRIVEITSAFHHGLDPLLKARMNPLYEPETRPGHIE